MTNFKEIIISTMTGVFISVGWWVFIDGVVTAPDAFPWFHIVPGFLMMISVFAINLIPLQTLEESIFSRFWIFFWVTIGLVCIGVAMWITTNEYEPAYNWPGVSIILQTTFIFTGGILFLFGRIAYN